MTPLQAANPADPLEQLRDIALPEPISWWPPAPGWWLLLLLCVLVCGGLFYWWRQKRHSLAYRQCALRELEQAWQSFGQSQNTPLFLQTLVTLLRRTALHAYPQASIAGQQGESWLQFLDRTLQTTEFSQGEGQQLLTAPYQANPQLDPRPLYELCKRWIQKHKPRENQ